MPQIKGVLETSLYVTDLDRSVHFYQSLFGFELIYEEGDRMRALNVSGRQVLLLFREGASVEATDTPGGLIPPHDGKGHLHLAFSIAEEDLIDWRTALRAAGIAIESEVACPRGGRSLYFRDPDQHAIELLAPPCWSFQ